MSCFDEYRAKLCSADEAVKAVKSGDWVDYTSNNGFPIALDQALARRRDELHNVKVRGNLLPGPIAVAECDQTQEHFVYNSWHCSGYERKLCDRGQAFFTPMMFRNLGWYYKNFLTVDVAMLCVAPMDKHGYFSLSCSLGLSRDIIEKAKVVILEVNEALPRIHGGERESVHISEVDHVVEVGNRPVWEMPSPPPSDTDMEIAQHIFPHIVDGATVQLGIGGMPNALGELIAKSELKDLGMHTELCSDGYLAMYKAGKLTNKRKTLHQGKGVLGLAIGSRELYDWVDDNPGIAGYALSYVNDPYVIAQNDNMISINGCLNVDLYGQVASESAGTRQISGTGGQLDFVTGASMSKGGKSFLCMASAYTDKAGQRRSRILPSFNGDIVTTPRSQSYYIVTEYGCVNLAGMNTWQRADKLISIAHPDFRDELIKKAEEQRIWLPSNKR
jgi:butyryl-CoA:acetate CoA-transferase